MDIKLIPISAYQYYNNTISLLKENPYNNTINTNNTRGDIVSYKLINTIQNVNIYKIVYLSLDNRSKNITNMSGTLYIPKDVKKNMIISIKHQTYYNLNNLDIGYIKYANNTDDYNLELSIANYTNNIVVCADGIGYGDSYGNQFYLDPNSEIYPCVDAVIATRNLFNIKPIIPINYMNEVIQIGYDIGGMYSLNIANELVNKNFIVKQIISGAPYNFYNNMEKIIKINNGSGYFNTIINKDDLVLEIKFIYYIFLYLLYRKDIAIKVIKTDAYNNVLPLFENVSDNFIITFAKILRKNYNVSTIPENPTIDTLGMMDVSLVINIEELQKYNSGNQESCDFTNRFINLNTLQNIPIIIMYSSLDEICLFKGEDGCILYDNNINRLTGKTNKTSTIIDLTSPMDDINKYESDIETIIVNIKNTQNNQYKRIKINSHFDNDAFYNLGFIPIITKLLNKIN